EIIREKGTNRSKFFRGELDKYEWVDVGSSFLPSDITAAFLYAQCLSLDEIQSKRLKIWNTYYEKLKSLQDKNLVQLPNLPEFATNNAHIFYLVCKNIEERTALIQELKNNNIDSVFHYLSLHNSPFFKGKHDGRILPNADNYTNCLLRLPFYYELEIDMVHRICDVINFFLQKQLV
ncbi:MAG: DegT/DnrJ/EryC1/StrS family aminotransferase, partial [Bacteroidia bacterium]